MKKKLVVSLLLALTVSISLVAGAYASTITLADLVGDPQSSILVGDKLFNNFEATLTSSGTNTAPPDLTSIVVAPVTMDGNYGLEFQGGLFAGPGSHLDLILSYDVSVQNPDFRISDVHLIFNGAVTGTGFANVTESVTTLDGLSVLGQAQVENPPPNFDAVIDIQPPVSAAHVKKDIFLFGSSKVQIPGTANISFIDQVFSQSTPNQEIPEPSTLLLLGSGLLSAGIRRFRGRKR